MVQEGAVYFLSRPRRFGKSLTVDVLRNIYLVLQYLGVHINVELTKHKGRIDAIIEVEEFIYITEFKLEDAKVALQQIKTEKYAHSYYNSSKEVILMGIAFNRKKKMVKKIEWEVWDRKMIH